MTTIYESEKALQYTSCDVHELVVFGYIRQQNHDGVRIPMELIYLFIAFYGAQVELLPFSTTYKSPHGFTLTDDNHCAQRTPSVSEGYRYILANTEPVFTGEHCWRVKVLNPKRGWIVWGIAQQKEYETGKFVHPEPGGGAYGVTYYQQFYPGDSYAVQRSVACEHFNTPDGYVDIYLNADQGSMKLCVVGELSKGEPMFHKLPTNTKLGWVPYFVFGTTPMTAALRIARVPLEFYGIFHDDIFPSQCGIQSL